MRLLILIGGGSRVGCGVWAVGRGAFCISMNPRYVLLFLPLFFVRYNVATFHVATFHDTFNVTSNPCFFLLLLDFDLCFDI